MNKLELEQELWRIASEIEAHRKGLNPQPSIRAFIKQWPGLGSDRTWSKILKRDFSSINLERQLPNYRNTHALLQQGGAQEALEDTLYPDLPPAQAVTLAVLRLMHHRGKDRLILIEGGSGSSKSSCLDILKNHEACGSIITLEASDVTWRSPRAAMFDMLRALGVGEDKIPADTASRQSLLLATLQGRGRLVLAIDEAHHANGTILNLFKTLLNQTEVLLVLAGMQTLFRKLRAVSSEEAKQLMHNRLFARVQLGGPDVEGAALFLNRRLGGEHPWKKTTLKQLVEVSRNAGHWAFLRRVVEHLHDYGINSAEITDQILLSAVANAQAEIA